MFLVKAIKFLFSCVTFVIGICLVVPLCLAAMVVGLLALVAHLVCAGAVLLAGLFLYLACCVCELWIERG